MKVKCPTCNVIMKPYEREETFPEGDILIRLSCPECSMESSVTYYRKKAVEAFEDQDIIDEYNDGQLENLQDSEDILNDFSFCNPFSPAYNVADYAMRTFEIKPSLRFISEDQILFEYPTPEAVFTVVFNLEGKSVEYVVSDPSGNVFPYYSLLSGCAGLHDVDFTTYTGTKKVCEQVDTYTSKFLIKELGVGFR